MRLCQTKSNILKCAKNINKINVQKISAKKKSKAYFPWSLRIALEVIKFYKQLIYKNCKD